MARHPIDQRTSDSARRAQVFFRLDRILADEDRHPKIKSLSQRSRAEDSGRLRHYLRIARGHRA